MDLGISACNFMRDYYEKKPFFARASLTSYISDWKLFDDLIYASELATDSLRLFLRGPVPTSMYIEFFHDVARVRPRLVVPVIEDLLRQGASLVINQADSKSKPINAISRFIGNFVGERTAVNAYVAFGGDGAFGKHWDTHDVFVVQLIGRKRWLVYAPTFPMPLAGQHSQNRKAECPDAPVMDVVLEAGDVLYLPRGWWHHPLPIEGEGSAHIAVGIHPAHLIDYVRWCATSVMVDEPALRKSLGEARVTDSLANEANLAVSSVLCNAGNMIKFEQWFKSRYRTRDECRLSSLENRTSLVENQGTLTLNSVFDPVWVDGETVVNGVHLKADDISSRFIDGLAKGKAGGVGAIVSGMADDDRIKVCRLLGSLVREGVCSFQSEGL